MRLVAKADVVVENFRPDVKGRLGIDYETLRKVNKRIVFASISGFGQDGPYRDRPGFDQIAQGMGGLMSITGMPGQGPVRVGIPVADLSRRAVRALGIMTALLEREVSGEGQWIRRRCCRPDLHARFPGCALAAGAGSAQTGRQLPPDLDPDRRVQDPRRLHQHRFRRGGDLGALLRASTRRR